MSESSRTTQQHNNIKRSSCSPSSTAPSNIMNTSMESGSCSDDNNTAYARTAVGHVILVHTSGNSGDILLLYYFKQ